MDGGMSIWCLARCGFGKNKGCDLKRIGILGFGVGRVGWAGVCGRMWLRVRGKNQGQGLGLWRGKAERRVWEHGVCGFRGWD